MWKLRMPVLVASLALAGACGGGDDGSAADSAGRTVATGTSAGMAGHDMNRPPAKDADHEFLRMMSDHHEGLVQMATAAMSKGSNPTVQGDAHRLHTKQQEEQKKMIDMVRTSYGENVMPMIVPSDKTMLDELQAKSGAEYDKSFYRNVVAHHREGIRMMDDFAERVTREAVKQMIQTMKADQQKEIAEFERKARA